MKKDLETKRLDGLRTAKTDRRHSHHLVLGVALVCNPSLRGFSELGEPSRRRCEVLEEGERKRETVNYKIL